MHAANRIILDGALRLHAIERRRWHCLIAERIVLDTCILLCL
jgi:hypothetical protein